ncbi:potassium/proton antiporter (CPA1 family) [Actinomadura pelletieri DSM 43383]|uniref:Potassium/proton antiporter (CPA1 family) n=1 Tax=Actinomadura pelletieri DSM 43383 TaxID=1120940 RepID=A0A495QJK0_9ACTN|nr:potassium/proton antiporter [Actinomadura pelletieri]RKS72174.1 potassium/proton antiporter (CPA1 family) [Actinomadura pelletieri DSM 43383]
MHLDIWLLLGSALVLCAIVAVRLSHKAGLPTLLAYMGLGLFIGESGPLHINFDNVELAETLGLAALVLILAEGGVTTSWRHVRPAVPAALSVSTIGTLISIVVVALAAMWLVGLEWQAAFLLAAVLAPTDAAAVFSVLRRLPLPSRLSGLLEAESGFNDAPVVIIVVTLSAHASAPNIAELLGVMVYELVAGGILGVAIGWLGAQGLRRIALPASGLYPIAVLSLSIGSYGAATLLHASGFLAVYVSAVVLGNARLPHRPATRGFAEGVGWLAQIGLFVMLGLLASPSELPGQIVPALVIGFVLLLIARPLSVWLSTIGFKFSWGEKMFASWAGLRGAVPIVLATIPMVEHVEGSDRLFAIVFNIVVVFTLLQGPTLPLAARLCRLKSDEQTRELDVEAAPLEELHADLLEVRIPADSMLSGVEIFELRLPPGASVTLVVRNGSSFVPEPTTPLQAGDTLLVVTTTAVRDAAERRLRAVSRKGRLAGWFGETGT